MSGDVRIFGIPVAKVTEAEAVERIVEFSWLSLCALFGGYK